MARDQPRQSKDPMRTFPVAVAFALILLAATAFGLLVSRLHAWL
jgi:hypothetical protein